MSCSYSHARTEMLKKGIINNYNELPDSSGTTVSEFNRYSGFLKNLAKQKYGEIPEGLNSPIKLQGKKVIFNNFFFEWADRQADLGNPMFQIKGEGRIPNEGLNNKLKSILKSAGISYEAVSEIRDRNGVKVDAVAVADMLLKTVKVIEGKMSKDTLPEEAAHFYIKALGKNNALYLGMMNNITKYPEYAEVLVQYNHLGYTEEMLKEEAMGKILAKALIKEYEDNKVKTWASKVWDWIKSKLGLFKSELIENQLFFNKAAKELLSGGLKKIESEDTMMYQLTNDQVNVITQLKATQDKYEKRLVSTDLVKIPKKYLPKTGLIERYVPKGAVDSALLQGRVTDIQQKQFVDKMGVEEAEKIDSTPDNVLKKNIGTILHAINEAILVQILHNTTNKWLSKEGIQGKPVLNDNEIKAIGNLDDKLFKELKEGVRSLLAQVAEQQNLINPDGKVVVFPEALLVNEQLSVGGSTDFIAIYSDNTASIFDYKTITPGFDTVEKNKLKADPIPFYKKISYNAQMVQYKEILRDVYGIKGFRHTRVVPIRLDFVYKAKASRKEGDKLSSKIRIIEFANNKSEFLKQLPLAYEKTGDKNLDEYIERQERILHNLESKIEKGELFGKELSNTISKIETIKRSLVDLRINKAYKSTIEEAVRLLNYTDKALGVTDVESPNYMEINDIMEAINELSAYKVLNYSLHNVEVSPEDRSLLDQATGKIDRTIAALNEELLQRMNEIAKGNGEDLLNASALDFSLFTRLSEVSNPVFATFYKILNKRQEAIRAKTNALNKELETALEALRKENATFEELIDPTTGNMWHRLTPEFREELRRARKELDIPKLLEYYDFREGKSIADFNNNLKSYIDILKEKGESESSIVEKVKVWKLYNDPTKEFYWKKGNAKWDTFLKPELYETHKSVEFQRISKSPSLLSFYELIEKKNKEFRKLLDLDYNKLPDNFLPNIKAEMADKLMSGQFSVKSHMNSLMDDLTVNEDRERFSKMVNPLTGELEMTVPIFYINPIRPEEKSKELATSMLLFGKMAYNYQEMSAIESDVVALKYLLENNKIQILELNEKGERYRYMGEWKTKLDIDPKAIDAFNKWMRYYIYGVKLDNSAIENDALGNTGLSKTKLLMAAKNYVSTNVLALNLIGAAGAYTASRLNLYFEGVKGVWYDSESSNKATLSLATDWNKYHGLAEYFQPFADDPSRLQARDLKLSNVSKYANTETLMRPYGKVDERLDTQMLNAMSHYWGVDEDGSVKLLSKIKKDWERRGLKKIPKSIWELTTYNKETDSLEIEGISEEGIRVFRNAVRQAKANVTGLLTDDDINLANINIYTNLLMQFKNWMPGMYKERFGGIKYFNQFDIVQQGKYNVLATEIMAGKETTSEWSQIAGMAIWSATKLAADLATFGLSSKWGSFYKVNEVAAKAEYTRYLAQHPEAKDMKLEDFIEMKQRQIASGLAEFRLLLMMILLVALAGGDWDDDGSPDYHDNWPLRQLYKVLLKAQLELGFATNPKDFITLLGKGLVPVSKILVDIANTLGNTIDETRDLIFDENSKSDKTPVGYYSSRWIYGINGLRKNIDWFFEQDSKPPK